MVSNSRVSNRPFASNACWLETSMYAIDQRLLYLPYCATCYIRPSTVVVVGVVVVLIPNIVHFYPLNSTAHHEYTPLKARATVTQLGIDAVKECNALAPALEARCALSDRNLHPRMPLDPTHVCLKLLHACNQRHSSRTFTLLLVPIDTVNPVATLKAKLAQTSAELADLCGALPTLAATPP
jgi:hypothetical protein